MTDQEARDLSTRLASAWRVGGLPAEDWEAAIRNLDAGSVGTAFMQLRSSSVSPSIEAFLQQYAKLKTEHTDPRWQESCPHDRCSGDGWITTIYEIRTEPQPQRARPAVGNIPARPAKPAAEPTIRQQRAVKPCSCPMGQSHVPLYEKIAR